MVLLKKVLLLMKQTRTLVVETSVICQEWIRIGQGRANLPSLKIMVEFYLKISRQKVDAPDGND